MERFVQDLKKGGPNPRDSARNHKISQDPKCEAGPKERRPNLCIRIYTYIYSIYIQYSIYIYRVYLYLFIYLAILCNLFGMVKYPFQRLLLTSNWGTKRSRLESPGNTVYKGGSIICCNFLQAILLATPERIEQ